MGGVGRELRRRDDVDRQHDPAVRLVEQRGTGVDHLGLEQRLTDLVALGLEEGEAHAAADQQLVDLRQQRLDHGELVGDLRAAEHHHVRLLGVVGDLARGPRPRAAPGHPRSAGAGAARRTPRRACGAPHRTRRRRRSRRSSPARSAKAARDRVVLRRLPLVEAQVLQQQHLAVRQSRDRLGGGGPDGVGREHRPASRAAHRDGRRPARGCTSGPARPSAGRGASSTITRAPASRSATSVGSTARARPSSLITALPRRVGLVERDVQVGAHEHAPTRDTLAEQVVESLHVSSDPDQLDQVDEAVRVAPLVVVPADDLDLVADDLGEAGVEDAGRRVGDDVRRDDRVLGVDQVALQRAVGGGLDRRR